VSQKPRRVVYNTSQLVTPESTVQHCWKSHRVRRRPLQQHRHQVAAIGLVRLHKVTRGLERRSRDTSVLRVATTTRLRPCGRAAPPASGESAAGTMYARMCHPTAPLLSTCWHEPRNAATQPPAANTHPTTASAACVAPRSASRQTARRQRARDAGQVVDVAWAERRQLSDGLRNARAARKDVGHPAAHGMRRARLHDLRAVVQVHAADLVPVHHRSVRLEQRFHVLDALQRIDMREEGSVTVGGA